jgi:hypothetical protein
MNSPDNDALLGRIEKSIRIMYGVLALCGMLVGAYVRLQIQLTQIEDQLIQNGNTRLAVLEMRVQELEDQLGHGSKSSP